MFIILDLSEIKIHNFLSASERKPANRPAALSDDRSYSYAGRPQRLSRMRIRLMIGRSQVRFPPGLATFIRRD